jgi:8-oxo-dGTP pyrophosphatase MutT (NUDIX family)
MHDVFQSGLVRGAAKLPFAPHKRYFYVEHPTEGWRVYLRASTFLHPKGEDFDASHFVVVKRFGADPTDKSWEPPKGQMEAKDTSPNKSIMKLLNENVRREVDEEAKIHKIEGLKHTGLVLQGREADSPPNHFFQYHIFQGFVAPAEVEKAVAEFEWLNEHPKAFARLKKDRREKDELSWYRPRATRLSGRWSPGIVTMYLEKYESGK